MKSVVLLSGGIDSAVLLAALIELGNECHTVTFDYGQQNRRRENAAAIRLAQHYEVSHKTIPISPRIFARNALHGDDTIPEGHAEVPDATVVPGRNMVMLSCAVAYAASISATGVSFGANMDDHAGYPDCRHKFIDPIDEAAYWGCGIRISAPLTNLTKPEIICLARELEVPIYQTWSCYRGDAEPCGRCGACELRREALA